MPIFDKFSYSLRSQGDKMVQLCKFGFQMTGFISVVWLVNGRPVIKFRFKLESTIQ
jgi:hypothetical protein